MRAIQSANSRGMAKFHPKAEAAGWGRMEDDDFDQRLFFGGHFFGFFALPSGWMTMYVCMYITTGRQAGRGSQSLEFISLHIFIK